MKKLLPLIAIGIAAYLLTRKKKIFAEEQPFPWNYAIYADSLLVFTGMSYSKALADAEKGIITEEQFNTVMGMVQKGEWRNL